MKTTRILTASLLGVALVFAITAQFVSWGGDSDKYMEGCDDEFGDEGCYRVEERFEFRMWEAGVIYDVRGPDGDNFGADIGADWDSQIFDEVKGIDEIRAGNVLSAIGLALAVTAGLALAAAALVGHRLTRIVGASGLALGTVFLLVGMIVLSVGIGEAAEESMDPQGDSELFRLHEMRWGAGLYLTIASIVLLGGVTAMSFTESRVEEWLVQAGAVSKTTPAGIAKRGRA